MGAPDNDPTELEVRLLPSGWWYCLCVRDCNCTAGKAQLLHQPEHHKCRYCGVWKPEPEADSSG